MFCAPCIENVLVQWERVGQHALSLFNSSGSPMRLSNKDAEAGWPAYLEIYFHKETILGIKSKTSQRRPSIFLSGKGNWIQVALGYPATLCKDCGCKALRLSISWLKEGILNVKLVCTLLSTWYYLWKLCCFHVFKQKRKKKIRRLTTTKAPRKTVRSELTLSYPRLSVLNIEHTFAITALYVQLEDGFLVQWWAPGRLTFEAPSVSLTTALAGHLMIGKPYNL